MATSTTWPVTAGALFKIVYTAADSAPIITAQPTSITTSATRPVTFSVTASSASAMTCKWQKNGVDIADATASTYTIPQTAKTNAGTYRAIVTNSIGSTTSDDATLTVKDFNTDPTAQITLNNTSYAANTFISFSGTATDKEDGTLPASAFSWTVLTRHDTHTPLHFQSQRGHIWLVHGARPGRSCRQHHFHCQPDGNR
ncbi:MAG: immunoglobulin domain-containing protein [Hymenobacter sp.]